MTNSLALGSTLPAPPTSDVRRGIKRRLAKLARPLVVRAARAYVAGDTLAEALAVQAALAREGRYATLGYWSDGSEQPGAVLAQYQALLVSLASNHFAGSCSVKLPALAFQPDLLSALATSALAASAALHCDSHGKEDVDRTLAILEDWQTGGLTAGTTLPGRWRRSVEDARWAASRGAPVRVVKGQWADPDDPARDPRRGFLEVVDSLAAARARRVAVATHDPPLATEAIERLRAAGVSVTLELLYGLPLRSSLALARCAKVDVRIYVPFGASYLPYALSKLAQRPDVAWRLFRDLLAGAVRAERRVR